MWVSSFSLKWVKGEWKPFSGSIVFALSIRTRQLLNTLALKFELHFTTCCLCLKIAEWVANIVDSVRHHILQHLIWVCTVCSDLSVWILTVYTVILSVLPASVTHPLDAHPLVIRRLLVSVYRPMISIYTSNISILLASVAQLDARPTGDQEIVGSTPTVGNILSWRLIMKYFLRSFSPFRWFKKASCQFLAKECAQYWLTA